MANRLMSAAVAVALLAGLSAFGDNSEFDGKPSKAPSVIIKKLDDKSKTVVTYEVKGGLDASLKTENLDKLSKEEQKAKIEAFLKASTIEANKTGEEKVEVAKVTTEFDKKSSTSACGWRWRGCYSNSYYGGGFYGYYNYNNYYYQPYWNYSNNYGYGCGGGGYYNNYNGYYNGGYGYSNYQVYVNW